MLHEAVYGQTLNIPDADKTRRVQLVPPTALAFEHTAVLASSDFVPQDDQDITDPGREDPQAAVNTASGERGDPGTPTPAKDPRSIKPIVEARSRRTSFGVTFSEAEEPVIEQSLVQEIDASDDFIDPISDPEADTRSNTSAARWKTAVLFGGIFLFAIGLGFLAVWLALK